MRLTCPNCEAQYEVPDDAVPASGRDVQCSNCGHTWFAQPKSAGFATRDAKPQPVQPAAPVRRPPSRPTPQPARAPVSDQAKSVLRQEAERELAARQADLDPSVEVQPDLDLDAPPKAQQPTAADLRKAAAPQSENTPPPAAPARRDARLPDVDEINSTLSADTQRANVRQRPPDGPDAAEVRVKRKRGFRFGFVLALFVLALATAAYVFAPDIAVALPNLADDVNNYVLWVNDTRQALFKWAEDGINALQGATAGSSASTGDQN